MIHTEWLYRVFIPLPANYFSILKIASKGPQVIHSTSRELKFKVFDSNTNYFLGKKHYTPISVLFLARNLKWLSSSDHILEFTRENISQLFVSVPMVESSIGSSFLWIYSAKSLRTSVPSSVGTAHTMVRSKLSCSTVKIWGSPTLPLTSCIPCARDFFFCAPIFPSE